MVIAGVIFCCGVPALLIGGAGFFGFNKVKDVVVCEMAFEDIRAATLAYAESNGGKLPDADKWMDQVRPFYVKQMDSSKEENPFGVMPADGVWGCPGEQGPTGIAYNRALSGKNLSEIKDKAATIVIFEIGKPEANKSADFEKQDNATSPKIFGESRGWFTAPIEGEVMAGDNEFGGGRKSRRANISIESGK